LVESEEEELIQATIRGLSRSIILWLLDQKRMSGYMITKELKKITGQQYTSGGVYPILYELEERELITGEWEQRGRRRIKYYSISEEGKKVLNHIRGLLEKPVRVVLHDFLGKTDPTSVEK
jgi:PadR family transcriptional regulator PadR